MPFLTSPWPYALIYVGLMEMHTVEFRLSVPRGALINIRALSGESFTFHILKSNSYVPLYTMQCTLRVALSTVQTIGSAFRNPT